MVSMLLAPCSAEGMSSHAPENHSLAEDRNDAERAVGIERLTGSSWLEWLESGLCGWQVQGEPAVGHSLAFQNHLLPG